MSTPRPPAAPTCYVTCPRRKGRPRVHRDVCATRCPHRGNCRIHLDRMQPYLFDITPYERIPFDTPIRFYRPKTS
ncbi:hypothetical protein JW905_12785 [bacterium]|nr:hypothetical protein [candidate division CSSED10-310 bacterium]